MFNAVRSLARFQRRRCEPGHRRVVGVFRVWCGLHDAAELGDRLGSDAQGIADGAHDFEGGVLGFAGLSR